MFSSSLQPGVVREARLSPRLGGIRSLWAFGLSVVMALMLSACGDVEETLTPTPTLSGTAATGAPLVGATVDVTCRSGAPATATTDADGKWTVALADRNLPCKLRARAGRANNVDQDRDYHSVATETGVVNITPLTDLAVAQLAKEDPSTWFVKTSAADFAAIDTAKVTAAVTAVVDALGVKTFLGNDNPLTTPFTAKVVATDKIDQALEALKKAGSHAEVLQVAKSTASAADLASAAAAFKSAVMAALPTVGSGSGGGGGGGGGGGSSSGGGSPIVDGGGGSGGSGSQSFAPIGVASFKGSDWGTLFAINKDKVLGDIQGSHAVAIFRVPAGKEAHLGAGKLTITGTNAQWSMKLEAPNGEVISEVVSTSTTTIFSNVMGLGGPVKLTLNSGTSADKFIDAMVNGVSGAIAGVAGGFSEYGFRNNVLAYGPAVPPVFKHLAGSWRGPQATFNCGQLQSVVTISDAGSVTNAKQAGGTCQGAQITAVWDGNDDFVGPADEGGVEVQLNTLKAGGSLPEGGVRVLLTDVDGAIAYVQSNLAGAAGNISLAYPSKDLSSDEQTAVMTAADGLNLAQACSTPAPKGTYSLVIQDRYDNPGCINGLKSLPTDQAAFCASLPVRQQTFPGVLPTCSWDAASRSGSIQFTVGVWQIPYNVKFRFYLR